MILNIMLAFKSFIKNFYLNKFNLIISIILFASLVIVTILVITKILPWQWITGWFAGMCFFLSKIMIYKYAYRLFSGEAKTNSKLAKKYIWLFIILNFIFTALLLFIIVYFNQLFNIIAFVIAFTITDILIVINYLLNFNVK